MNKPKPPPKRRILVVDDEPGLTRLIRATLEGTGRYEVFAENRADHALAAARSVRPDLILLDVMMPERDGGAIAADLRSNSETRHIPIVFLTAAVQEPEVKAHGGMIGGFPFVAKPVSKDDLIATIEKCLAET